MLAIASLLAAFVAPLPAGAQAGRQTAAFLPYTGTAEMTLNDHVRTTQTPGSPFATHSGPGELPNAAMSYQNTRQIEIRFAVRDATHFRFDIQTILPVLEAGTRTVVVNGSQMTVYDTRSRVAASYPVPGQPATPTTPDPATLLRLLMQGNDLRGYGPLWSLTVLPDPTQSLDSYFAALKAAYAPPGTTRTVRIVGQDTLLGRPVEVVDYGPIVGNAGTDRLWIDMQHPFILQYQAQYSQPEDTTGGFPHDLDYHVTSLNFGQGPSDSDLQPSFPVPVQTLERAPSQAIGEENGGENPPAPFLIAPQPDASVFPTACDRWVFIQEGPAYGTQAIEQLFSTSRSMCGNPPGDGQYIMVQQRIQVAGLPAALQVGQPQSLSGCQIYSGAYPDGQHWAAFARGQVSILATTNALSQDQLVTYAGALCASHEATTDTNPPGILPPTDWYCVGGTPAKPTITIYRYAQRGEQCFHYLDQAVAVLSPSVQEIIPPGASGSVNTSDCSMSGNAATDPPGAVYFVRCPNMGGQGWSAGWSGSPDQITDGPNPIKPGEAGNSKKSATSKKVKKTTKHKNKKSHASVPSTRLFVTVQ
jgi:hypothetical protein